MTAIGYTELVQRSTDVEAPQHPAGGSNLSLEAAPDDRLEGSESGMGRYVPETHSVISGGPLAVVGATPPDRHPAAVYLARLSPGSRRTMRHALDVVAVMLTSGMGDAMSVDWPAVRYQHAQAVRTRLAEEYAPATANKVLSALRGVLRETWRLGLVGSDDFHRAVDLEPVKGETVPAGRSLAPGEMRALLATCSADVTPAGPRDAALLALLYGAGLRRSEAVALDLADCDPESGAVTVRRGKGNKGRVVYAVRGAADALSDWLDVRGTGPGPLFHPVNKGGRVDDGRMSGQAVMGIVARRAKQSGVAHVRPHDFRRSFVGDLLDAGADIATVQRLMGHAQIQTTAKYDRRGEATKRKAAGLLHVPYVRRAMTEPTGSEHD
jgi:site-specific recombinase XerD